MKIKSILMLSLCALNLSQNILCITKCTGIPRESQASLFNPERLGHLVDALFAFYEQDYTTQLEINSIKAAAIQNAHRYYQYVKEQGWKIFIDPQSLVKEYLADATAHHARECYELMISSHHPSQYIDRGGEVETEIKEQACEQINTGRYGCLRFFVGKSLEERILPFYLLSKQQ